MQCRSGSVFSWLVAISLVIPTTMSPVASASGQIDIMQFATAVPVTVATPGYTGVGVISLDTNNQVKIDPTNYALPSEAAAAYLESVKNSEPAKPAAPAIPPPPPLGESEALNAIEEQVKPADDAPDLEEVSNYVPEETPVAPVTPAEPMTLPEKVQTEAKADCLECMEPFPADRPANLDELRAKFKKQQQKPQVTKPTKSLLDKIMSAIRKGVGHVGSGLCWRAVKMILLRAKAISHYPSSESAYEAIRILPKEGFKNVYPKCDQPGTVRVYRGYAQKLYDPKDPNPFPVLNTKQQLERQRKANKVMQKAFGINASAGDIHGHIEIVGTDGCYHHFVDKCQPITELMYKGKQRRILEGCFVK